MPTIKANTVEELTQSEFMSMIVYMVKAEAVFDTIASREKILKDEKE